MKLFKVFKKNFQLKQVLLFCFLFLVFLSTFLMVVFSYSIYSKNITKQLASSRVDVLEQISERTSSILQTVNVVSNFYYYNLPFNRSDLDYTRELSAEEQLNIIHSMDTLDGILQKTIDATNIDFYYTIALNNGFTYSTDGYPSRRTIDMYQKKLWYADIIAAKGQPVLISTHRNFSEKPQYVFSMAYSILHQDTGEQLGIFLLNVKESNLSATYESLINNNNSIYIIDQKGTIISHNNKDMLSINFYNMDRFDQIFGDTDFQIIDKNKEKFLFSKCENSTLGWVMIEEIPLEVVLRPLASIQYIVIIFGFVVFLVIISLSYYLSSKIVKPLSNLCQQLEKVGSDEAPENFNVRGWAEINTISDECNYMLGRINMLVEDIKLKEESKRQVELQAMLAQMNPHFIYNTLFSVKCMVDMGRKDRALGVIDAFTVILKNTMSYTNKFMLVSDELNFLENYITLQKYRYGDIFDFITDVPEQFRSLRILRMMLQPLIENSIFHGFSNIGYRGQITLRICSQGGDLLITLFDNGTGMDEEQLNRLWDGDLVPSSQHSNLIGIRNISDRLLLHFGPSYGITIDSKEGCGTRIRILHPRIENDAN
ncbi:histidine kinase [Lachnospiraceae bacterium ASD3451]|uniref:sensor histidine kinase n=1 Tax=Diplocloster agilis TaxID=2850323 RepID=UPI001DACE71B|nr:sensor histidine kinase [Diplocloster agilis]MBU9743138.1 histidine kinase [Diplocloster agilis]